MLYDCNGIRNNTYHIADIINQHYDDPDAVALDLGCGTCRKIIPLSRYVKHYFGIDHNDKMLAKAQANIDQADIRNISVHHGNNFYLPFGDNTVQIISAFLTTYSIEEIIRVLSPGGKCIIEILGTNDKKNIKEAFGKDQLGWRGSMLNNSKKDRRDMLKSIFQPFFNRVDFVPYSYETTINREQFEILLQMTPTIRNFSIERDRTIIDSLCDSNGEISFVEEKIIVCALK